MENNSDLVIESGVLIKYNGPGGDVVISAGIMKIGDDAFRGCMGLTSVTIPESMTEIDERRTILPPRRRCWSMRA